MPRPLGVEGLSSQRTLCVGWVELLYAVPTLFVTLLSLDPLSTADLPEWWRTAPHRSGVLALAIAVIVGTAIRRGAKGPPIYVSTAFVGLVLLAPVDRAEMLRLPVIRHMAIAAAVGAALGAALGVLLGPAVELGSLPAALRGALGGMVIGGTAAAVSVVAAGGQLSAVGAWSASALLAVWAVADSAAGVATSPMSWTARWLSGEAAWTVLPGIVVAVTTAVVAARRAGGISLEGLSRASTTSDLTRVAASLNDPRSWQVARRARFGESFRQSPRWGGSTVDGPAIGRVCRSWARWPAGMVGRIAGLSVVTGTLLGSGDSPAVLAIAAATTSAAAFELLEPFSQHADRRQLHNLLPGTPRALARWLVLLSLIPAFPWIALASVVSVIGFDSPPETVIAVTAAMLAAVASAALAVWRSPRPLVDGSHAGQQPEAVAMWIVLRVVAPVIAPAAVYLAVLAS